ncbi:MAG: hypothetical protein HY059_22750 [Proteobacteria bacterium]|nr:hypothetical protein [Pseudomonadota bacterium]
MRSILVAVAALSFASVAGATDFQVQSVQDFFTQAQIESQTMPEVKGHAVAVVEVGQGEEGRLENARTIVVPVPVPFPHRSHHCTAHDATRRHWTAHAHSHRHACERALHQCHRHSRFPRTCRAR